MNSASQTVSSAQPTATVIKLIPPIANIESIKSAWYALIIIGGQILLPLILLTMILSKNVRRGPALINFIVVTIEFSFFCALLLYAGAARGPEPPFMLCLGQASLLYGSLPAMSLACFFVVFQIWKSLRAVTNGRELEEEHMTRVKTALLVVPPHALSLIFLTASLATGMRFPEFVTRGRSVFYCSIAKGHIDTAASIISLLIGMSIIVLEIWIIFMLYSKWSSTLTDIKLPHSTLAFQARLIKRVMVYTAFALCIYLSDIFQEHHPVLQLIFFFLVALLPMGVALVFGTQASMLRVWCFWKPRKLRTEEDSYARTFSIVCRRETLVQIDSKLQMKDIKADMV